MKITKEIRMLEVLAHHPQGLTKLEAIQHSESCLNTTISKLEAKHQLKFERTPDTVQNRFGGRSTFVRYRLVGEQRELALCIVRRERERLKKEQDTKKTP